MLKTAGISDMSRATLYYDEAFYNAVVRCISTDVSIKGELTLDREYEAYISESEVFAVVTNDKMLTRSYSITNFEVVKRVTVIGLLLDLLKYISQIY